VLYAWLPTIGRSSAEARESLSYWVGIPETRLVPVRDVFSALCEGIRPGAGGDIAGRIIGALERMAEESAGEREALRSTSIATALSLPFWERLDILNLSPFDIEEAVYYGDVEQLTEMRRASCRTEELLRAVEAGRRIGDPSGFRYSQDGEVLDVPSSLDYRWVVRVDRGEGVVFLPLDYFP